MSGHVICEFRRTIFSERRDIRAFPVGTTVAEMVKQFDCPREFAAHGAVILYNPEIHGLDECGLPNGQWLDRRDLWRVTRPKANTAIFISIVPQSPGGGGGGHNKSAFTIVAAIALIALTVWVGGGGLAFLSPQLLGAGTIGAKVAAAAIGVAGSMAIGQLTKPPVGQQPSISAPGGGTTLGSAGIAQNQIAPWQQLPGIVGYFRCSPPFLMRPFTTLENSEQVVQGAVGVPGHYDISDIRVDTTPVADLPAGQFEYEVRNGSISDTALTLVTGCGFEETPRSELSKHRLDTDHASLIEPYTASYPKEQIIRTARNCNRFRITLQFPSGVSYYNSANNVLLAFRLRIRRVGTSTWINLPEAHFEASYRDGMRQEIWLSFGTDESAVLGKVNGQSSFWPRFYYKNSEWSADSYFSGGDPSNPSVNTRHCYQGLSGIYYFLNTVDFPLDQYDVGITRGFADTADGSHFSAVNYIGGLFTWRTFADPAHKIPDQSTVAASTVLENYTTFRDVYPIARSGMSIIAFRAHNLTINSISALFKSYAGTGSPTNDPGALLSYVLTGDLNGRPLASAKLESLSSFTTNCAANGLTCNALVQGSVEQTAAMIAQCGEALLRRSDKWGVVIDKDRSAESVVASFSPSNMTAPLTIKKTFLAGAAQGLLPSFHDETQDWSVTDSDVPIYDDGVEQPDVPLVEGASYEGITRASQVRRRALRDLRAARMRSLKYTFGTHQSQLNIRKGSIVGLSHDVLTDTYATGRVKSFTASGGNLIDLTLNADLLDLPPSSWGTNFLDVDNALRIGNVLTLSGPDLSAQVELLDGTVTTAPIASIDGRKLTISGTVPVSSALEKTCLVAVGPAERVTRRVILADISPADDLHATVTCVDEAPDIYKNLPSAA